MSDQQLTIADAAVRLKVSPHTIRRMIARGDLKAARYGRSIRIDPRDLSRAGHPVTSFTPSPRMATHKDSAAKLTEKASAAARGLEPVTTTTGSTTAMRGGAHA